VDFAASTPESRGSVLKPLFSKVRRDKWWRYGHKVARSSARNVQIEWAPFRTMFRGYTRQEAKGDARAGLNTALLAFPQSIAYSLIAGLPAQFGLLSSGFAAMIAPLFTRSRFIVVGPTNGTAILIFSAFMAMGLTDRERIIALPLFLCLVGLFLVLGAVANLSLFVNYVSRTVLIGYVCAAAILIIANQVQNLLGFRLSASSTYFAIMFETIEKIPRTRLPEVVMSLATLVMFLALKRFAPRLPNIAVALALASGLAYGLKEWLGWRFLYLPGFSLEEFGLAPVIVDFDLIGQMAGPAIAVAFLSILEGASIGKSLAARSGERINVNQEMYSLGLANMGSAVFGGMNASGSLTRSVLNAESGARTPAASIFSGAYVLVLMFTVGLLIGYIPKAALAVLVICIAVSLFDLHAIKVAFKTTRSDAIVFVVTCGSALLFNLSTAIYMGAFTSILLFLRKAGIPDLREVGFNAEGRLANVSLLGRNDTPGISILHAEGDLFFGSTEIFVEQTRQVINDPNLKIIVLRLKNARHLDATCVLAIGELLRVLRSRDRHLLVSGAKPEVFRVFRNSGLLFELGRENFFPEVPGNPTISTRNALKRAKELLGGRSADIRIFVDATREAKKEDGQPVTG
jgi:SulP family sulfate permease